MCTAAAWFEGLTVSIQGPDDFVDGTYQAAIEADGVEVSVAADFVDGRMMCSGPEQGGIACSADVAAGANRRLYASIDSFGPSQLMLNLYYVDDESLAGGPEVARIRLLRDGETIGDSTFEPEYVREEPNGEDCGVATTAQADFNLSPEAQIDAGAAPDLTVP